MPTQPQILVPLDGSDISARALPYAALLASALAAEITLLAVWQSPSAHALRFQGAPPSDDVERDTAAAADDYLAQARSKIDGTTPVTTLVRRGNPSEEIIDTARAIDAKLIVMSTHGRSGLSRWRLGSVAGRVLRESDRLLLAIGPRVLTEGQHPVAIRRIMVALDGSLFGEAALPAARELASALDAQVTLARSVASAFIQYPFAPLAVTLPALDDQFEAEARAYLESTATAVPGAAIAVFHGSDAAARLCEAIDEQTIDLMVLTTHARAAVGRAVLGSTADRLVQCGAPVLLVHPG